MALASRPYHPERDRRPVLDLFAAARAAAPHGCYLYLTHYRLDLLLTSRLLEPERDAQVWCDGASNGMVGFAMLWRRSRERRDLTLECFADPQVQPDDFDARALEWARGRGAELARELGQAVRLIVVAGAEEHARADVLRRQAFTLLDGNPVRMSGALPNDVRSDTPLPQGFALHRLGAEADLDAYAALYDQVFSPVSADHRRELLRDPDYAHLVVAAPDGALAAFCECSIYRAEWALGGRRMGEIDYLGTLEGFQHRGLGGALVDAARRQLRAWGAEEVSLITGGINDQAQRVYRRAGMEIADRAAVYALAIAP